MKKRDFDPFGVYGGEDVMPTTDFYEDFTRWTRETHLDNLDAGWWNDPVTKQDLRSDPHVVVTKMMLIVSEISEAVEAYRKDLMDSHLPDRKGVEVELADAIIRIADMAGCLGMDIGAAIREKLEYNQNRLDHKVENRQKAHGKRF